MLSNCPRIAIRRSEIAGLLFLVCTVIITRQLVAQQPRGMMRPVMGGGRGPTVDEMGGGRGPTVDESIGTSDGKDKSKPRINRLDESLLNVLENHPEIVAAKAKVALAEAELNTKRFEVTQHIIPLVEKRRNLQNQLGELRDGYKEIVNAANKATNREEAQVWAGRMNAAIEQINIVQTNLSSVEAELGKFSYGVEAANLIDSLSTKSTPHVRSPEGPIVDRIKTALDKPESAEFLETPLVEVLTYLTDKTDVKFSISPALSSEGYDKKSPVSLNVKASLRAMLQAIEDALPNVQFVVRDYGILLTTTKDAEARGFTPAVDFARPSEPDTIKTFLGEESAQPAKRPPGGDGEKTFSPSDKQADPLGRKPGSKAAPADNPPPNSQSDDPFGS